MVYIAGEGTVAGSPGFENQICEVHNRIIKPTEECIAQPSADEDEAHDYYAFIS